MLHARLLCLSGLLFSLPVTADPMLITGSGATFPYPLYAKWFNEYRRVEPSVAINYQSIGSGGGIRQLIDNTVDFGASDAPMTDEELKKAFDRNKKNVLHIPTVLGAVVVSFNLPQVKTSLKLNAKVISAIFRGEIQKWNDPKVQALNSEVALPNLYIQPVYRSDGSGTTAVFTDYLAKADPIWKQKVGAGKAVKWPVGQGGKGNEGVAGVIKQSSGAIGYLELVYAKNNDLSVALIQNAKGAFASPTLESIIEAAASALDTMPADFRVSITNPERNEKAYPISAFTYLLVYQKMDHSVGGKIKEFLKWALGEGQAYAANLSYAPLPASLKAKVLTKIETIELY